MTDAGIFAGMPFDEDVRLGLREAFPDGDISLTAGRHYSLEENFRYLVRSGAHAAVMPRMAYSASVIAALDAVYGKENHFVGQSERAAACGDHS